MTVSLTIAETLHGSQAADTILGGAGQLGVDMGPVTPNNYAPLINKANNQGKLDLYVSHNGTNPITAVSTFIQSFGTGTGYTYGGAATAAADYATLKSLGNSSGSSKNNADGLSGGIWVDYRWNATDTTRFDRANFPTKIDVYGHNNTDGLNQASALTVLTDAMVWSNGGIETAGSAPVAGQIGHTGNTALGDSAHLQMRIYLPSSYSANGTVQFEFVLSYSFTS